MWVHRLSGALLFYVMTKNPKAPRARPRQLFSSDYSSCWEEKLQTLLQLLRNCSAALKHLPASSEGLSTRSSGRSTLLPAWPGLPAKSLAGSGRGPVPRWSTAGLAVGKTGRLCVCMCVYT